MPSSLETSTNIMICGYEVERTKSRFEWQGRTERVGGNAHGADNFKCHNTRPFFHLDAAPHFQTKQRAGVSVSGACPRSTVVSDAAEVLMEGEL